MLSHARSALRLMLAVLLLAFMVMPAEAQHLGTAHGSKGTGTYIFAPSAAAMPYTFVGPFIFEMTHSAGVFYTYATFDIKYGAAPVRFTGLTISFQPGGPAPLSFDLWGDEFASMLTTKKELTFESNVEAHINSVHMTYEYATGQIGAVTLSPEPSTVVLFGSGAMLVGFIGYRRRQST